MARCPAACRPAPGLAAAAISLSAASLSAADCCSSSAIRRLRACSPASRMTPFSARNSAVSIGLLKYTRKSCSSASPAMPTGMVARMIIQASVWSVSCGAQRLVPGAGRITCAIEAKKPLMMRSQSRQKKMIMAIAVATCIPTMNARYGDSGADTLRSCAQLPPISAGISTLCPRLDTGNSSVTPWISPTTIASGNVMCAYIVPSRCRRRRGPGPGRVPGHGIRGPFRPGIVPAFLFAPAERRLRPSDFS